MVFIIGRAVYARPMYATRRAARWASRLTAIPDLVMMLGILIWAVWALIAVGAAVREHAQAGGGRRSCAILLHALIGEDHQLFRVQMIFGEIRVPTLTLARISRFATDTVPA